MTNKEIETLDEVLEKEFSKENKPKKGNKKIIIALVAGLSALAVTITGIVMSFANLGKKKNTNENTNNNTTTTTNSIDTLGISDMGNELEFPTATTRKYGEVSGNIDLDKIVEQDGKIYKDKENASNAKNTTTSIDLKNDTLKTSNGKVYSKTTGYVIIDKETGKTIATGNLNESGIPDGYAWDSVLKKYLPKEEVGKYIYADATYYDKEGTIAINKGDVVSIDTLNNAKKYLSTIKPTTKSSTTTTTTLKNNSTTTTTVTTTTTTSDNGVVNEDGTYTIYGMTFLSKSDYQQWILQGYEGYAEVDGIMRAETEEMKQAQKVK